MLLSEMGGGDDGFADAEREAGEAAGAGPKTFAGLAGVGDLIATCGSPLSRNYTFGSNLGKGLSVEEATKVGNGVGVGVKVSGPTQVPIA